MNRLLATLVTDVRLQVRNGFYYAVAFVLAVFAVVVSQLHLDWSPWLPPIMLGNLSMATFYFVGGLVLLERGEGTLEAQVVTPLRVHEYLASKVLTLTALSLGENLILVSVAAGFRYRPLPLLAGITAAAAIYTLVGFVAVARYDSINEYLMPSVVIVTLLSLPCLSYFDIWNSRLMLLHPLQGALTLMKAAFQPVPRGELVVGSLSAAVWTILTFGLAARSFRRFVVAREGVR